MSQISATASCEDTDVSSTATNLIDCDVHPAPQPRALDEYLPVRWRRYVESFGLRGPRAGVVSWRPFQARADAIPENGLPGSDPDFARKQLLDPYDIDCAVLNAQNALYTYYAGGNQPRELSVALMRATNDWLMNNWFTVDPRWRGSICIPSDYPRDAVAEIERCLTASDRWVQVHMPLKMTSPLGNACYEPILEAVVSHDIPLGLHVGGGSTTPWTGVGHPSYFYELHVGHPQPAINHLASLIFEGVLDRWPTLRISVTEANWSWVAPFAWRLDASWRVLRDEVPMLQRKPSEYVGEHFWFSTQPAEEPENPRWSADVHDQFARLNPAAGRLMFASDYPHWDFDSPIEALPTGLTANTLEDICWRTASDLYGIRLQSQRGTPPETDRVSPSVDLAARGSSITS